MPYCSVRCAIGGGVNYTMSSNHNINYDYMITVLNSHKQLCKIAHLQKFSGWLSTSSRNIVAHAQFVGRGNSNPGLSFESQQLVHQTSPVTMPKAYSTDLRWRVVWVHITGQLDVQDIALKLCISQKTVRRYLRKFSLTGDVEPVCQQHGPPKLLGSYEELIILRMILDFPGIYLHEIQQKFLEKFGVSISAATFCRTLKRMGCTRQVIRHVATQQSEELRARFMAEVSVYDPAMLLWIDESGCDRRDSIRKYGYSVRGSPANAHILLSRGKRYSAIPIMSQDGIHDVCLYEGTVNGDRFKEFIQHCLLPILLPFNGINPLSVVIMDNASIHHVDGVSDLIETQAGARLLYLPPYSPDLNPLEEAFSQVKKIIKQNDALFQASSIPRALLCLAFSFVSKEDCASYIHHSGYV